MKKMSVKQKKRLIIVLGVILALIAGSILAINLYADSLLNRMNRQETFTPKEVEVVETHRNIDNIALLGVDADEGSGNRTDVMKIISLDFDEKNIKITSLQRDNIVYQPMMERYEKLNHAYWRNGVQGTLSSINYNFDLDVTEYVLFDFNSVEEIVDILGGIDIYVSAAEAPYLGLSGAGAYHLTGAQVLTYSRIREIDNDYNRMGRQTKVIEAMISKFSNSSPLELLDIVNQVLPFIETNLSNGKIKNYATKVLGFDLGNIQQFQFPKDGYDSQLTTLSLYGFTPQYVLKDFSAEVEMLHHNIYGIDEPYQASETVLKVEKEILELAGY